MEALWSEHEPRSVLSDKENRGFEEVFGLSSNKEPGRDLGRVIPICVTTNRGPIASTAYEVPEPLSPSKRFQGGDFQSYAVQQQLELLNSGALIRREPKQQICFDYTKGLCKRGSACKYSHDVEEIVRVNSQERGVCFDFLRNSCQRGLLCRFSHDLSSIAAQKQQGSKQGRKNAPICYDFVKGVCKREDCRYSHDLFSIIRGKNSRNGGSPEVCYDFTRGKCDRGSACRYSHDLSARTQSLGFLSTDAVAAMAAQQAQLAAAAAVALEADRRQSAPGSMQPVPESLLGLLGSLALPPAQSTAGPGYAGLAEAQAAWAVQVQAQQTWLMQLQAQSKLLQARSAPPAMPRLSSGNQLPLGHAPTWPPGVPAPQPTPRQLPPHSLPVHLPTGEPHLRPMEARRHTHDGSAAGHRMPDALVQQLQELDARQQQLRNMQQMRPMSDLHKAMMASHDSIPEDSTIRANWQAGQEAGGVAPPLQHQLPLRSLSQPAHLLAAAAAQQVKLATPTLASATADGQDHAAPKGPLQQDFLAMSAAQQSQGLQQVDKPAEEQPARVEFLLRQANLPPPGPPASQAPQLAAADGCDPAGMPPTSATPADQADCVPTETLAQGGGAGLVNNLLPSLPFDNASQPLGGEQLAICQQIWRQ